MLVVVDDATVGKSNGQWLGLTDFASTVVTSAAGALARLADDDIDLVLTGVRVPGQDGLSLLKVIRDLRPAVPVLMVTCR